MIDIQQMLLLAPPILLALTVHEYAHGYIAHRFGDDTAKLAGRLTLNPISHLDPIGTLMLFIIHIGWAKPVPVNPYNLRNPKRDLIYVSLAGPAANVITAFIAGTIIRFLVMFNLNIGQILGTMLVYTVLINLVLAFFNLIPLAPLDGSKILGGLLKGEAAYKYAKFERYGPIIFIAVIAGGFLLNIPVIWWIISPFVSIFSILFTGMNIGGF
jgi:Zn-dependent protease